MTVFHSGPARRTADRDGPRESRPALRCQPRTSASPTTMPATSITTPAQAIAVAARSLPARQSSTEPRWPSRRAIGGTSFARRTLRRPKRGRSHEHDATGQQYGCPTHLHGPMRGRRCGCCDWFSGPSDTRSECRMQRPLSSDRTAGLRYLSDRKSRQDTPNQRATAASQTAAVRTVLPLDEAL